MVVVIFESHPHPERKQAYLEAAARLGPIAQDFDGFISIERFESLTTPGKLLALGTFRDEDAVDRWRNLEIHRRIQDSSRKTIFVDYRLRVAQVMRDYSMKERAQAPEDSRKVLG
jgi:heme-degrading monooxygenase HmoA